MTQAIWKFGPIAGAPVKIVGKPISVGEQHGEFYVWTIVDPTWKDLPNTKESDELVEWHTVKLVPTGWDFEGTYIGTIHTKASDNNPYVFHLIEVEP